MVRSAPEDKGNYLPNFRDDIICRQVYRPPEIHDFWKAMPESDGNKKQSRKYDYDISHFSPMLSRCFFGNKFSLLDSPSVSSFQC